MRWAKNVARMWESRSEYVDLAENPDGKKAHDRPRRKQKQKDKN